MKKENLFIKINTIEQIDRSIYTYIHRHTHTHIYIYIFIYICIDTYIGRNQEYKTLPRQKLKRTLHRFYNRSTLNPVVYQLINCPSLITPYDDNLLPR